MARPERMMEQSSPPLLTPEKAAGQEIHGVEKLRELEHRLTHMSPAELEQDYTAQGDLRIARVTYLNLGEEPSPEMLLRYPKLREIAEVRPQMAKTHVEVREIGRREVFFPAVLTEREGHVRFISNLAGEVEERTKEDYLRYLGFNEWNVPKQDLAQYGREPWKRFGIDTDSSETQIQQAWRRLLVSRGERTTKAAREIAPRAEDLTIQEQVEPFFVEFLKEAGPFRRVRQAEATADALDKGDVFAKLPSGKWILIQLTLGREDIIDKKTDELLQRGVVTIPERLERGEMPLVLVADTATNYFQREGGMNFSAHDAYRMRKQAGKSSRPASDVADAIGTPTKERLQEYQQKIMDFLGKQERQHPARAATLTALRTEVKNVDWMKKAA